MQNHTHKRTDKIIAVLICLTVLTALTLYSQASLQAAQSELSHRKLSNEMEVSGWGDSYLQQGMLSADGDYAVFRAEGELYSVRTDGMSPPVRLNNPLLDDMNIEHYRLSPDSSRVIYQRVQSGTGYKSELFSVPITGGVPIKLGVGGDYFVISPNSKFVVYSEDLDLDGRGELIRVPLNGGAAKKLIEMRVDKGQIKENLFEVSPDSKQVVYIADQDVDDRYELYSVSINGNQAAKLNGNLASGADVRNFVISADGSQVVYSADQDTAYKVEIYSVPITGGQATRLNDTLAPNGNVYRYKVSPDSTQVVYLASPGGGGPSTRNLYSVPIAGGRATRLDGKRDIVEEDFQFEISPDSSRVVFVDELPDSYSFGVYSTPIGGGSAILLSDVDDQDGPLFLVVSQDSTHVVFRLKRYDSDHYSELYSVPIGGGRPTRLNDQPPNDGDVWFDFTISSDSSRVVYRQDQVLNGIFAKFELFSVPIGGGEITTLNQPLVIGGNVQAFEIGSGNDRVVYVADQELNENNELYVVLNLPTQQQNWYLPLVANGANQ